MSASVVASAPGKVILFGEHAVVHGMTAVAGAVSNLRIYAEVTPLSENVLEISLPDVMVDSCCLSIFSWAIVDLEDILPLFSPCVNCVSNPDGYKIDAMTNLLSSAVEAYRPALLPILYLTLSIVGCIFKDEKKKFNGIRVEAKSVNLPVGAGLGSSAALCVSTAAALLEVRRRFDNAEPFNMPDTSDSILNLHLINEWAFSAETLIHGNPSGLDNTVSCHGGVIRYVREPRSMEFITEYPQLSMLLVNTLVPGRSTKKLVAHVGNKLERYPAPTTKTLEAIDALSKEFLNGKNKILIDEVGTLMKMNHHLLGALGVGHPSLDAICQTASKYGCWAKLTGAGGGGCALVLLPINLPVETHESLIHEIKGLGFECYQSEFAGQGVKIHS